MSLPYGICYGNSRKCLHPGVECYREPPPSPEVIEAAKALYERMVGGK